LFARRTLAYNMADSPRPCKAVDTLHVEFS
jgi:hypothetical protein